MMDISRTIRKSRILKIIALFIFVVAIVYRSIIGISSPGILVFMSFFGMMIYVGIGALTLLPPDWQKRSMEPARLDNTPSDDIEKIKDKVQLKMAFAWVHIVVMLFVSLLIAFGDLRIK